MSNIGILVEDFKAGAKFRRSRSSRTDYGVLRVSFDERYFYSYQMKLAYRNPEGEVIINGDGAPSVTTRKHQGAIRGRIRGPQIPFSVLERLNIPVEALRVVHHTDDFTVPRWVPCKRDLGCWFQEHRETDGKKYHKTEDHFLGETLFEHGGDLYISGLDRNEPPRSRHFYVARLPLGCAAKTVDEGLISLRPAHVPETALRQGEWFFVPTVQKTAGQMARELSLKGPLKNHVIKKISLDSRPGRHMVSQMITAQSRVFVSGFVRDQEHATLKLPDGWYEVFRNLSRGGFSIDASNRVNVD
jgi:hypothetical protein